MTSRNPGSLERFGSAVADFMVPLAWYQTGGSIIRPATTESGFKATLDGLDRGGIAICALRSIPSACSLDPFQTSRSCAAQSRAGSKERLSGRREIARALACAARASGHWRVPKRNSLSEPRKTSCVMRAPMSSKSPFPIFSNVRSTRSGRSAYGKVCMRSSGKFASIWTR
jgi:hypothetical protein